jgi:hypothetical protein
MLRKQRSDRVPARVVKERRWPRWPFGSAGEEGQGLVEAAVSFLFLLMILLAMFEMVMVFSAYISLLNTSTQGAIYASGRCSMEYDPPSESYLKYVSIMESEALAGGLSWVDLRFNPPVWSPEDADEPAVTVTVEYTLTTFFSEVVFPMFGRFGLPTEYHISARSVNRTTCNE